MRLVKEAKRAYMILSGIFMLVGLCLTIWPEISIVTFCCVLGGLCVIYGIIRLVGYFSKDQYRLAFQFDLALGIFVLVFGIILLFHPRPIIALLPVVIGLYIAIDSVFKLQTALDAKRFGMPRWWLMLILAIVAGGFGILLVFNPFEGAALFMRLIGITLIIDGIQNLWAALALVKVEKRPDVIEAEEINSEL